MNEIVYERNGVTEIVRIMLRPLLDDAGADELSAPRLHAGHERALADSGAVREGSAHSQDPAARARRDGLVRGDVVAAAAGNESAVRAARRHLRFHERALAGFAALHGAESFGRRRHPSRAAVRDARDARRRADAALLRSEPDARAAARSARPVSAGAARPRARDRPARQEHLPDRAEVRGRGAERAVAPRRVLPRPPRHQAQPRGSARAQARRRRGLLRGHAHRRGVPRLRDSRPACARARARRSRSTRSARCFARTAWCPRSRAISITRAASRF